MRGGGGAEGEELESLFAKFAMLSSQSLMQASWRTDEMEGIPFSSENMLLRQKRASFRSKLSARSPPREHVK
jgi:hypothetical protein